VLFVGLDWAETHHDVAVMDEGGRVVTARRVAEGLAGLTALHELLAGLVADPAEVVIGTETDRGLFVGALVAAGYQVYAVNPLAVSRYRDRHTVSGAKSDAGDAKVLADLVRTDRHNHRPVAGDSELAEAVKVLARTHQSLVWTRRRQVNQLRSLLREFYPGALAAFGTQVGSRDALAVQQVAPTPTLGRQPSRATLAAALVRAGRQRGAQARAVQLQAALRAPQLQAPTIVADAYGAAVLALVGVTTTLKLQLIQLTEQLEHHFEIHPDAEIVRSLPGLGVVLGARVVAEFGDDPTRYANPKARKNDAGTPRSPAPPANARSWWPDWPATGGWPIPATCGRSRPLAPRQARVPTTTGYEPPGPPINRPCGPWPTAWSASSTAACATGPPTTSCRPGQPPPSTPLDPQRPWGV
jgi:transposase